MALVSIQKIKDLSKINISYVETYYPRDVKNGSKIFFIISRVFNDVYKQIDVTIDVPFEREVIKVLVSYSADEYYLKIDDIVEKYHIAKGYYLEIILQYVSHDGKIKTIFPGEIRYQSHEKIENLPEVVVNTLISQLEPHEIATKLASLNYSTISADLTQSMKRFDSGDSEGSIKFSRKVVEGIRQLKIEEIIEESNRQEKIKSYLNSSFNLLSNFGEHTGTTASDDEALLAKDIALGLSRYLVSKHSN